MQIEKSIFIAINAKKISSFSFCLLVLQISIKAVVQQLRHTFTNQIHYHSYSSSVWRPGLPSWPSYACWAWTCSHHRARSSPSSVFAPLTSGLDSRRRVRSPPSSCSPPPHRQSWSTCICRPLSCQLRRRRPPARSRSLRSREIGLGDPFWFIIALHSPIGFAPLNKYLLIINYKNKLISLVYIED